MQVRGGDDVLDVGLVKCWGACVGCHPEDLQKAAEHKCQELRRGLDWNFWWFTTDGNWVIEAMGRDEIVESEQKNGPSLIPEEPVTLKEYP